MRDRLLRSAAGAAYKRLLELTGNLVPSLPCDVPEEKPNPSAVVEKATLAPKVLKYIDGKVASKQDEEVAAVVYETLAWDTFMLSEDVVRPMEKELVRAAVVTACIELTLAYGMGKVSDCVRIRRGGNLKGYQVQANRALKPNELMLAPLTTSLNRVQDSAPGGWAPSVEVKLRDRTMQLYLFGNFSLPALDPVAAASPAVAAVGASSSQGFPEVAQLSTHAWRPTSNPWPFWGVRRTSEAKDANLEFTVVAVNHVLAFNHPQLPEAPMVEAIEICLPVLRNTREIEKGDELVALWVNRIPPEPKAKKGPRVKTWVDNMPKSKKPRAK